jgi:CspA family cold shock protein
VISSAVTPGGCFAHYSAIHAQGYRALTPGDRVEFRYVEADQDGYAYRAEEVWPATGPEPRRPKPAPPSGAYSSTLTITYDDPPGHIPTEPPA